MAKARGKILMMFENRDGVQTFCCALCPSNFSTKEKCIAHIRAVHLTKGTECKFCGKSYKKIQQHISDVHCDLEFKCDMCSKLFASNRLLKRHIEMYHLRDENVITSCMARCEVCRIGLNYRKRVQHIELSHLLPPEFNVSCPVCKISVKFLPFHLNKCHKKINIKRDLFPCRKCRRYFLTMSELKAHDTKHVSYSCQICGLVFHEFLQLGWHLMQTHHKVFNLGIRNRSKRAGIQEDFNNLKLFDFDPNEPDSDDVDDEIQDEINAVIQDEINAVRDEDGAEERLEQEDRKDISEMKTFSVFVNEDEIVIETTPYTTRSEEEYVIKSNPDYYVPSNPEMEDEENDKISRVANSSELVSSCDQDEVSDPAPGVEYSSNLKGGIQHTTIAGEKYFYIVEASDMVHDVLTGVHEVEVDDVQIEEIHEDLEVAEDEDDERMDEEEKTGKDEELVTKLRIILAAEKKINLNFLSKQDVPSDLRNIELEDDDETLLRSLARDEGIELKDLSRLQVCPAPENRGERVPKNRFKFTNSRQAHVCPYCRVVLKTRYTLQSHISVKHFNNKPLICTQCRKSFANNSDLKKHMKTHEPEDMDKCDVCSKDYRKGYLARHKQFAHSLSANIPADCDICGKSFKKREIMMQHRRRIHRLNKV